MARTVAFVASAIAVVLAVPLLPAGRAAADAARPAAASERAGADSPDTISANQRDRVLGPRWRQSADRAWTIVGDGNGMHVLVADARDGYTWRTAASLAEPGFDTDQWIGNACVTGSGRRLAVVYAPRTFTNRAALFARGGFTAVVDLDRGAVTKLAFQATLAYYSPACDPGETALFTQAGDGAAGRDTGATRLIRVDAASGAVKGPVTVAGQVTSAVPVRDGIVAADAGRLVRIDGAGRRTELARTRGVPFRLVADADGGVVFMDRERDTGFVRRAQATRPVAHRSVPVATVARGRLTELDLLAGAGGRAYVAGRIDRTEVVPASVRVLATPRPAGVSTRGEAVVTSAGWAGQQDPRIPIAQPSAARPVAVTLAVLATGQRADFRIDPGAHIRDRAGSGRATSPTLAGSAIGTLLAGSPSDPVEDERTCSVPRNDPHDQVLQPKPRQVEWAVDQAVRGALTVKREQDWKNLDMPAYTPQELFPPVALTGGGFIPAQVMLGVIAQESNLWQASSHVVPGVTGNPLIGNYYGRSIYNNDSSDDWAIHWVDADCGYGVVQLTDGMRRAGRERPGKDAPALPEQTQRAVALDFAANVAAGVRLLAQKWNMTRAAGLVLNDGNSQYLENWFFAVWAYNSGFHPQSEASANNGAWGLGWLNNPANPHYPANRPAFLETSMTDATHPQDWPYPEKVMGFAGHPIDLVESPNVLVAAFRPAWWPGVDTATAQANRAAVKPPPDKFCDSSNTCEYGKAYVPTDPEVVGEPAGPCAHQNANGQYDLKCWYHQSATWKPNCAGTCGRELLRFDPGYAYQEDGTAYPPNCGTSGLPTNALIIDDVPATAPSVRPNCTPTWTNAGTFTLGFAADAAGNYPSKVDFHQLGGGFNGHLWFAHTRTPAMRGGIQRVTGTWKPNAPIHGWTRIKVHVPDQAAWTRQAKYVINLGDGNSRYRVVNQYWQAHTWVDLGVFNLAGNASVVLSTDTADGTGDDDIAFDAVALIPTSKPAAFYVAMGDSYSSGEGVEPYDKNSDYLRSDGAKNACHRSQSGAYPRLVTLPGHTKPIATEAAEGTGAFAFIACSGALTTSVTNDAVNSQPSEDDIHGYTDWGAPDQHWGEVAQVDQGYLDQDTTLVNLTIGGNDARFSDVLTSCIVNSDPCYSDLNKLTRVRTKVVDPEALRVYEKKVIRDWLPKHLEAVYRAVHARAPNAQILVLGYPQLFADRVFSSGCAGLAIDEMEFLNTLADLLNIAIAKTVEAVRATGVFIRFLNPTQHWREANFVPGNFHWACGFWTNEWTNGWLAWSETGSGRDAPGVGSFHPTAAGQRELAAMVNTQLRGVSTPTQVQQRIRAFFATRGWTISEAQAIQAADTCLLLAARGGVVGDPCMSMSILFPTAADAYGAALNDNDAIAANPLWVNLNYVKEEQKKIVLPSRNWYESQLYQPNPCTNRPSGLQCDEYPFYSTELGGSWDFVDGWDSPSSSGLKPIPESENKPEGNAISAISRSCGFTGGSYNAITTETYSIGTSYLIIPLLMAGTPNTFYVC
jgi:GDSL-like Lipase/Acylhydrolase family